MRIFKSFLVLLVLAAAGFVLFLYSGSYNIAATRERWPSLAWSYDTLVKHSVRAQVKNISPPALEDAEQGFRLYDAICITCHGAPGVAGSAVGTGLNPSPPDLADKVAVWSPGELFWITKHGLQQSGMPGFDPSYSDGALWDVVAFLRQVPELSPGEYQQLQQTVRGKYQLPTAPPLPPPPEPAPEQLPQSSVSRAI